ncbi:MAG: polyprenyl synthetase family protein [Desulfobacteraceae bacterium]|nr:MAG: polyprenyl synthetase family protein [Desulfobacteraceae bacterium]
MIALKTYLDDHKSAIDAALIGYLRQYSLTDRMLRPLEYAISAGGKRVRPILCISACIAVGGQARKAMPLACALEMIHTYSLIHDDLPALDNDDLRRGKPTCHIQFNEATAILAGDALLTMAFEVIAEAASDAPDPEAKLWLQILRSVSEAAGCRGMIEGQARDLGFEGIKLNRNDLESMHRLKTGALINASVHTGALIGMGSDQQIERLNDYAANIGLAFQVVDDILNVTGDASILGKAVGTDQSRQKNTYPALLGLEQSELYAAELIDRALLALEIFDKKADPLRAIARYILYRNR